MRSFVLELYVHDVTISHQLVDRNRKIWCVLLVDGADEPVSTSALPMRPKCDFCRAFNVSFQAANLTDIYFYITVCSFGAAPNEMVPLCRAKTRVAKLPLNGPTAFRMPLCSVEKPHKPLFYATVSGTIEPIVVPAHRPPPLSPQLSAGAISGIRRRMSHQSHDDLLMIHDD
jgi:hypothetical protein